MKPTLAAGLAGLIIGTAVAVLLAGTSRVEGSEDPNWVILSWVIPMFACIGIAAGIAIRGITHLLVRLLSSRPGIALSASGGAAAVIAAALCLICLGSAEDFPLVPTTTSVAVIAAITSAWAARAEIRSRRSSE
ncbi:MAG: hypothetical protein P0Y60_01285 [Candidatus Microbacterium colombiense]|nr:MAG: hypothetical protein P0Y60_01285 [Microbacterium sp.]